MIHATASQLLHLTWGLLLAASSLLSADAWAAASQPAWPAPPVVDTINIAQGASTNESSPGWGGGAAPQEMVDGAIAYAWWAHGLAFTGGQRGWAGVCGVRQAVVDFGVTRRFSAARVWHHGTEHIPETYSLHYWNGSAWVAVGGTSRVRPDLDSVNFFPGWYSAIPTEHIFPEVQGSKLRFTYDNCQLTTGHGWIYEFEVFGRPSAGFSEEFNSSTLSPEWQLVIPKNARNQGYGPANHFSLTDSPGKLRFYLDPITHSSGFFNGYTDIAYYDPSIEIIRKFAGSDWILETKVDYYVPAWANGRSFDFRVVFGDPGPSSISSGFSLWRDSGYNATRLYSSSGAEQSFIEFGQGAPDRLTFYLRIEKRGSVVSTRWSSDGVTWNESATKDFGAALDGLEQRLIINGSCWYVPGDSYADYEYVKLTTSAGNQPPVANAGLDQQALVRRTVILDGSGSADADGDPLQYSWTFDSLPAGSLARISRSNASVASFVPDRAGTYVARLTANDGRGGQGSATTRVTAVDLSINTPPVAIASGPQSVGVGATARLDGSRSYDPDGEPLTFKWSLLERPAGSTAALTSAATAATSFVADVAGTYDLQLRVSDGNWQTFARHKVRASGPVCGVPPVANAGVDTTGIVGRAVALSAANSRPGTPGGRLISYRWALVSQPPPPNASVLPVGDGQQASLVGRNVGRYVVRLTVMDQCEMQASDEVVVTINESEPVEPPCPGTRPVCTKVTDSFENYHYECGGRSMTQTANPRESLIDGFQLFGCTAVWQYKRFDLSFTPIDHAWYSNRTHIGGAPKRFSQLATQAGKEAIRVGNSIISTGDFVLNGAVAFWLYDDDFTPTSGGEAYYASCIANPALSGMRRLSGVTATFDPLHRQFLHNPRIDSVSGALRLTWELCDSTLNGTSCSARGPVALPNCPRE